MFYDLLSQFFDMFSIIVIPSIKTFAYSSDEFPMLSKLISTTSLLETVQSSFNMLCSSAILLMTSIYPQSGHSLNISHRCKCSCYSTRVSKYALQCKSEQLRRDSVVFSHSLFNVYFICNLVFYDINSESFLHVNVI